MSLANIKLNNTAKSGFTIVELLIVVVVIAILAAITIVSYNGITTKANASAAKSTAATWQKKIELYQAEVGSYPFTANLLSADATKSYHITTDSLTASLSGTNGKNSVIVMPCGSATPVTAANTTGARIQFWDYEASTPAVTATPVIVGSCTGNFFGTAWN